MVFETEITSIKSVDEYGAAALQITKEELIGGGLNYADLVMIEFDEVKIEVPVVPTYRYIKGGSTGLVTWETDFDLPVQLLMHYGSFSNKYHIDETRNYPIKVKITLTSPQGYYDTYILREMSRSRKREDYPHLGDFDFANFREIKTTGMKGKTLYRGSNPIDDEICRAKYVDEALRACGIRLAISLSETKEEAEKFIELAGPNCYYATIPYVNYKLNIDLTAEDSRRMLGKAILSIANAPGPYFIHCKEGQDRTGILCALLEALMGASYEEINRDYLITFYNFYGIKEGTEKAAAISMNLMNVLEEAFDEPLLVKADLMAHAERYIKGLLPEIDDSVIEKLREKLGA